MLPHVHEQTIRIRYKETDKMGVVYHSNYLVFFEVGRTEFLRSRGAVYRQLEEQGVHLAVSEAACRYLGPLRYDDQVIVETWVSRLSKSRMTFQYRIVRLDGDRRHKVAEGSTTLACLTSEGKPRRIPDQLSSLLADVMHTS